MRESKLERYFVRQVRQAGGDVRKLRWIGRRGAPDRLVLWPGRIDAVELKAPGGRTSPLQTAEHIRLRRAGLLVYVLSSLAMVDIYIRMRGAELP